MRPWGQREVEVGLEDATGGGGGVPSLFSCVSVLLFCTCFREDSGEPYPHVRGVGFFLILGYKKGFCGGCGVGLGSDNRNQPSFPFSDLRDLYLVLNLCHHHHHDAGYLETPSLHRRLGETPSPLSFSLLPLLSPLTAFYSE